MIISLRIPDEDAILFRKYAELNSMNLSEMIRACVHARIESYFDLEAYREALAEYRSGSETVEVTDGKD